MEFLVVFGVIFFFGILFAIADAAKTSAMTPDERTDHFDKMNLASLNLSYGTINGALKCPHCQVQGNVRTKLVDMKKGVSGAKATGALLTGGVSLLATGLSRKEKLTKARCDNCSSEWVF